MTRKQKRTRASAARRKSLRLRKASELMRAMNPGRKFRKEDGLKIHRLKGGGFSVHVRKAKAR